MDLKTLLDTFLRAIASPDALWQERLHDDVPWTRRYVHDILPMIVLTTLLTAVLTQVFGYQVPFIGVIRPSMMDALWQMVGSIVLYSLSLTVFGYIAAYLASLMEGRQNMDRAVEMLFLVSIPSLLGQILGTLPYVGVFLALGFGVYSLVLLYRAIPSFLDVPLDHRTRHMLLFITAAIVVSILMNMTLGALFAPKTMPEEVIEEVKISSKTTEKHVPTDPEAFLTDFFESMSKGDHGTKIISDASDDTFIPPKDRRLTKAQVDRFMGLATRIEKVREEQRNTLSEKYDRKQEEFSISDIFNGIKDVSNLATLDMRVVKTNGGNWAEFQWVKDQIREAYFTPSLNETTEHNARLIEAHKELLKSIL